MGEVHDIRVKCPYEILNIEDIKIECKPNQHGYLYLKCLIDDSIQAKSTINAEASDKIFVYEGEEESVLFNGIVKSVKTNHYNGNYYLEIEGITFSSKLDIKIKSRSFQNASMTYEELLETIFKDYKRALFTLEIDKSKKIGKPIFQYKETDWEFLKRLSSELNTEIYCDIIEEGNIIYFGRPEKKSYELEDNTFYKACKNLKKYHEAGGNEAGFHDTDYFYYEIMRKERYSIGDQIDFKNKKLYISEYEGVSDRGELIYKYRLCRKNGVWMTKKFNSLISGASLEGKVLAVEGEKVKLHLDIDEKQSKEEAAWFTYAPPTGNMMYSMPIVGTKASLYFADETQVNPTVVNCIRKNGGSCAKTSDTSKRYFGTEHGSEIEMTPEAINIKGGSKEPLSMSFDDNIGVTITSPKKLTLTADDEIVFKTPKKISVNAKSQILLAKTNTKSGVSIETDFQFLSNNVIQDGRDKEAFAAFDDAPKKPEPPKKKEFNWWELGKNVLAGLAVAAAVTVLAVAVVATGGAALVAVGAVAATTVSTVTTGVAVGGAIAGTLAVAGLAASDIERKEVSDMKDYMISGAREAFVGAVIGAIFAPFSTLVQPSGLMLGETLTSTQMMGTLFRTMVLGGTAGSSYYLMDEAMQGRMGTTKGMLESYRDGAIFAGILHSASPALSRVINRFTGPKIVEPVSGELKPIESGRNSILSYEEAEEIAFNATNGSKNADAVVLGKYGDGGPTAYTSVAKDMDAQYFQLDNWNELSVKYDDNQIWKINEKFLDIQTSSGRDIYLSHNPAQFRGDGSFYSREIQYLEDAGYKFVEEGGIWHAVR